MAYKFFFGLYRQIIRKFKKRKAYLSFRDNIWGVDSGDMQLLRKYNTGTSYLLCSINLLSKYAWVAPLKKQRGLNMLMHFKKSSQNDSNQIKYGLIKVGNFTASFLREF